MNEKKKIGFFDKFKTFIKEEWKFLLFLVFMYLAFTYELPYAIYKPGGAINMSERVSGDNVYDESGSLSMTYVSMVRGTAPFLLLAQFMPNWDVISTDRITYDDADLNETVEIDKIYMREAISNAEYVAYRAAGIEFEEKNKHNIVTYVSKDAKTKLRYGDEIFNIDGEEFKGLSDFQNYVSAKNVGDEVRIEYERNDKREVDVVTLIEMDGKPKVGLSIASISDYGTFFNIEVETKSSESGPSGGLMTALAIYNRILEEDITKGLKIMGTGTIEKDGTVGEIGGVKYKLLGAYKEGADVFICPEENYEEALKVKNEEDMDIELISAKTFENTLNELSKIKKKF